MAIYFTPGDWLLFSGIAISALSFLSMIVGRPKDGLDSTDPPQG